MPVLVSGKQSDWKNRFVGGLEANHSDGTVHDRARVCESGTGGVAIGGGVERDFGVAVRSSSFTRRQEVEVRKVKIDAMSSGRNSNTPIGIHGYIILHPD